MGKKQRYQAIYELGTTAVVLDKVQHVGGIFREQDPRLLMQFGIKNPDEKLYLFTVTAQGRRPLKFYDQDVRVLNRERKGLLQALEAWHCK